MALNSLYCADVPVPLSNYSLTVRRSRILSDNSLRIENVQIDDDGVFVCRMENLFGSEEADARVTVLCKLAQSCPWVRLTRGLGREWVENLCF